VPKSSRTIRLAFGAAAVILLVALCLHMSNWFGEGAVNWPAVANMVGLLVLMVTGVFDPPPGPLRVGLTIVALGLIVPSAFFLVVR